MKGRFAHLISLAIFMLFVSCATQQAINRPPSATPSGPRTILLGRDTISEKDYGGFISWYCKDFIDEGPILVELGFFGEPHFEEFGFVLYDGGYKGETTMYHRIGLEHRWDWGDEGEFAFVIKSDGTGLYYDFSRVLDGESTSPNTIYKCYKR